MTNNVKVKSVAWSYDHAFIAVGGEDGVVRMIKVDSGSGVTSSHLASKNISVSQELGGHKSPVTMCVWNEIHQKLTTCDANGLIIVWTTKKLKCHPEKTASATAIRKSREYTLGPVQDRNKK